jgi:hypothetical protein
MKVILSNYRNHWVSPYTILKKICFWEKDEDKIYNLKDDPNNSYEKWVNVLEPICKVWQKFLDIVHPKITYVKIDRWDTWSMDHTLADIILPMLKQLNEEKHGAPFVDDEDVPEELKSTSAPPKKEEYDTDDNHFKRWDWVMNEMIFAFECKVDDTWQEKFSSGVHDMKNVACEWDAEGKPKMFTFEEGPNHTYKLDFEGMQEVEKRIQNGFKLFGRYYQNLWD